jgi:hypothetical protein
LLLSTSGFSQGGDSLLDRLTAGWNRYADQHQSPGLFLHLDKSLYEHADHIQFTAWLLGGKRDTSRLHAVYVLLVDPATRKMVAFDRFLLSRYAAVGALYLDDTLHPGKYIVVAYTDDRLRGFDQLFFRQEITLLPDQLPPFGLIQQPDPAHLRLRVSTSYGGLGSGGSFHYRLQGNDRIIDSGEKKIDAFGEVSIAAADSSASSAGPIVLTATVSRQNQTAYFWLPVTAGSPEWRVHYYPEGGNLVAGHPCQVGIEIRDATGTPVRTQGRLLEDGADEATFDTDNNGWGLLVTVFHPGHSYSVDFADKPAGVRISGSLPALLPAGYTLLVPDGVARDSVNVRLYLPAADLECRLLIYNDHEIVYASSLLAHATAVHISIPVKDWPPGLLTMTLFDPGGVPVAERKLYSPAPALSVTIATDSAVYHPRSKIRLRVHIADANGRAIPGLFSLATVLSSRLSPGSDPDIRRYATIDQFLTPGRLPGDPGYGLPSARWENDTTINLLLLIRGWTRYHWQQVAAGPPAPALEPAADYGFVLYRNKKPKAPVTMLVMGGSMATFNTDSAGHFRIPPANLVSDRTNILALSLAGGNNQDDYRIVLLNRYDSTNHFLANASYLPQPAAPRGSAGDRQEVRPFLHAKTLQQAVVMSNGHGQFIPGCQDYVCIYNILNCKNHPYGRKPVIGEVVLEQTGYGRLMPVVYKACQITEPVYPSFLSPVKPICLLKEAYVNDTTAIPSSVNALYTTLHWAPLMATDTSGNAEISFYANDLPGQYDNILQGISTQGVISGRQSFRIKKDVE